MLYEAQKGHVQKVGNSPKNEPRRLNAQSKGPSDWPFARQLRFSDRTVDELIFACHRLATRYLLLKQNFDALGQWCRFAHHELRRGASGQNPGLFPPTWPSAATLPVRDAETGVLEEIRQDHLWKRPHDVAQLQFLGETVRHLRQKAQEMQMLGLDSPRGIPYPGNRASFVPDLRLADIFRAGALESAARRSSLQHLFHFNHPPLTKKAVVELCLLLHFAQRPGPRFAAARLRGRGSCATASGRSSAAEVAGASHHLALAKGWQLGQRPVWLDITVRTPRAQHKDSTTSAPHTPTSLAGLRVRGC